MSMLFNSIGIMGALSILASFFMSQKGTLSVNDPCYSWMNLLGSLAIIFSLFYAWNLPSFLINTAWAIISVYGIWKLRKES